MQLAHYSEVDKALKKLQTGFIRRVRAKGAPAVMKTVVKQTRRRWRTKKGPNGERWSAWSVAYAATRRAVIHNLNLDSGDLLDSLSEKAIRRDGDDLIYGSAMFYAPFVNKKRGFLGVGDGDVDELQQSLDDWAMKEAPGFGLA